MASLLPFCGRPCSGHFQQAPLVCAGSAWDPSCLQTPDNTVTPHNHTLLSFSFYITMLYLLHMHKAQIFKVKIQFKQGTASKPVF